ncbi:hypothetical protein [Bosea massiliensis]|uniref:Glycosyltransferase RgtA/B/C/D-like domain-containing protein n=1 Tax=Bosea massiliensis TaxID=151419 RepID=A0ABW0P7U7_9HYPH
MLLLPRLLFVHAIIIAILGVLFGRQILEAQFGIIDDHEIVWFLGNKSSLAWADILSTVMDKTEVGNPFESQRFRPFYYLARATEAALWGDSASLWYAARFLMFATFIGCLLEGARRLVGLCAALALLAYVVMLPFWSGIWDRLGPAEIYAACGLGIWFASSTSLLIDQVPRRRSFLGLTIGTFMMCGSKETLLPFALLSIALLVMRRHAMPTTRWYLAMIGCALPAGIIASVMVLQLGATGKDIYGNSVGFGGRTDLLIDVAKQIIVSATGLTAVAAIAWLWSEPAQWRRATMAFAAASASILLIFASQAVVYGRGTAMTGRYEFPALICLPALWLAMTAYLGSVDRTQGAYLRLRQAAFMILVIVTHQLFTPEGDRSRVNAAELISAVETNVETTQRFANSLKKVVSQSRNDPSRPIILECRGGLSYEPIASVARFLRHANVENPIAIRFSRLSTDPDSDFFNALSSTIELLQDQGLEARGDDPYKLLQVLLKTFQADRGRGAMRLVPLKQIDAREQAIVWPLN